jgi:peptide methionine sulfoxide reductase msrA/msrB
MKRILVVMLTLVLAWLTACAAPSAAPGAEPEQTPVVKGGAMDAAYVKKDGVNVIYVAGGCFWGTEKLMQSIDGVLAATSGYANGKEGVTPTYHTVSGTGFKETVRIEYEPQKVSLDAILFLYFRSIDPTIVNRQGNDLGTQYQSGVYWVDDAAKETVLRVAAVEKLRFPDFSVEIGPLVNFFDAEDYHQDYLDKNPGGYCHISFDEFENAANLIVDPAKYPRPSDKDIKAALTDEQYNVTQEAGTEAAFTGEYWDNHERGIYVDVVTGEPLFSSADKFDSGTGWPSFTKPIDDNTLVLLPDDSLGIQRTEVLSRAGNTHLGHVFYNGSVSPNGVRYCINSASLRFIPYGDMEAQGYGYLKDYVD